LGYIAIIFRKQTEFSRMLSDDSGFNSIDDESFKDQEFKKIDYRGEEFNSV
jgi:hypothetical protein